MTHSFAELLILLAAAVIVVGLFRRVNLPPILGYLFAGVLVGPHGAGVIEDTEDTRFLAEFGVVFLMFTIGLEFSLRQLVAMRREVLGVGGAQVALTALIAAVGAAAWGVRPAAALVIGGALAMSSTAIVMKQLTEQLELNTRHGRLALGILLFQDLAVIPFLIVIPTLAGGGGHMVALPLVWALVKGAGAFLLIVVISRRLLRPVFRAVAAARSTELFMLTVLLFTLSAAGFTYWSGLSLALGAFLGGMMMGETEFRHQVEADIRPFRDVLLGLFFITVGMQLDVRGLPGILHWVLLLALALVGVKTLLILVLGRLFGAEAGVALRTGMVLAQGGEFGFALLSLAMGMGLLQNQAGQLVLAAMLFSMAASPLIIRYNGDFAKRVFSRSYVASLAQLQNQVAVGAHTLDQHVIICGYGRIGQNIAHFLDEEGFDYIALDLDPAVVREALQAGERVTYGDSTRRSNLRAAGLERARALVVSYDDPAATLKILMHTREIRPDMPVLVRTRDDANLERFQDAGATEVVPETLEASLMLVSHLLLLLNVPVSRVVRHVREVRSDRYRMLRGFFHGTEPLPTEEADGFRERLHAVTLPHNAYAVNRTLADLGLDQAGVMVTAVRRGGIRGPQPQAETQLRSGDVLVLYGTPDKLEHAEAMLLEG